MALIALTALMTLVLTSQLAQQTRGDDNDTCLTCGCASDTCFRRDCCSPILLIRRLSDLFVSVDCAVPEGARVTEPLLQLNKSANACAGYRLYRPHSCLAAFPDGYCSYNDTRAVTLHHNNIEEFPDLQCLPLLGLLDLRDNKLRTVPEAAFRGVPYLRHLYLDNNQISYIHPKAFTADLPHLQIVRVSNNQLIYFEAGSLMVQHRFCRFDFSHNLITSFTNTNNFQFNFSRNYGPGYVDLSYNQLKRPYTTLYTLGFKKLLHFTKFYRWGFDIRHNPLHCDCNMYPIAFYVRHYMEQLWREYFNISCVTPSGLSGIPVYELPLEQLTCNVTEGCPTGCRCQNQPNTRSTLVDCGAAGLTSLPRVAPPGQRLALNLSHNSLHTLTARDYLPRANIIDLRGNGLTGMEESVPPLLRKAKRVDLRDNQLLHLPDTLQVMTPKALLLDLHTLRCSCDLRWVRDWLRFSQDHAHLDNITCGRDQGGRVLLASAGREDLGCSPRQEESGDYQIALIIGSIGVLGVGVLLAVFRYELLVLGQHLAARRKTPTPAADSQRRQVFVSVRAESEEDTRWAVQVLVPLLDQLGLSCFLPPRDCLLGSVLMDKVTKELQRSAAALVILSPDYVEDGPCLFQFARAYSHMLLNGHGPLLLLLLRPVSRRAARDPYLRAMLTLRLFHSADNPALKATLARLLPVPTALNDIALINTALNNTALNNTANTAMENTASTALNNTADTALNNTADTALNNTANTALNNTADTATNNTATSALNNTADTALNNTADTALNNTADTAIENTPNTALNNTANTALNNTANTALNNTADTALKNTANTAMDNTADTALDNTPNTALNNTANTALNNTADTALNNTADTALNNTANTALNNTADFALNNTADTTLNNTANTALNNTADTALNNTANTALNNTADTALNNTANTALNNTANTDQNKTANTARKNITNQAHDEPHFDSW